MLKMENITNEEYKKCEDKENYCLSLLRNYVYGEEVDLQRLREALARSPQVVENITVKNAIKKATNDKNEMVLQILFNAGAISLRKCLKTEDEEEEASSNDEDEQKASSNNEEAEEDSLNNEDVELKNSDLLRKSYEEEIEAAAASFLMTAGDFGHNKLNEELRAADTPERVQTLLNTGAKPAFYGSYSSTAVHEAAYCRRPQCLSILLQNGGDVTSRTAEQRTPLHAAAISGDKACVEILLKAGADIHALDYQLMTALHFAAGSAKGACCVPILVEAGANVRAVDQFGRTPLHYAAAFGTEQTVQILRSKGAEVNALDCWFQTPATIVYSQCDTPQRKQSRASIYSSLNSQGAVNVGTTFPDRIWDDQDIFKGRGQPWSQGMKTFRALARGYKKTSIELVHYLFSVDPQLVNTYSVCKALQKCAEEDRPDIIEVFMNHGGNPNARESDFWTDEAYNCTKFAHWLTCDRDNWPLLHLAAALGRIKVVNVLLEARASLERTWVYDFPDPFGPLEAAAQAGQFLIVKVLLLAGCVADREQLNGALRLAVTPVEWELEDKQDWEEKHLTKLARLLLEAGADPNVPDMRGHTAVIGAAENGSLQCLSMLVQWGGDVSAKTNEGKTALHTAAQRGHDKCVSFLIESDADVSAEDCTGKTPLHYAAEGRVDGQWAWVPWKRTGDQKTVEALLLRGAEINNADCKGVTPLHLAAASPSSQFIVEMLLNAGANINAADEQGKTPLHYAFEAGLKHTAERLLRCGANADAKDSNGCTPRDLAKQRSGKISKSNVQEGKNETNIYDLINSWEEDIYREDDGVGIGYEELRWIKEDCEKGGGIIGDKNKYVNFWNEEVTFTGKKFNKKKQKLIRKGPFWSSVQAVPKRWLRSDTARLNLQVQGNIGGSSKRYVKGELWNIPENTRIKKEECEEKAISGVRRGVARSVGQVVGKGSIKDESKSASELTEGSNLKLNEQLATEEFPWNNRSINSKKENKSWQNQKDSTNQVHENPLIKGKFEERLHDEENWENDKHPEKSWEKRSVKGYSHIMQNDRFHWNRRSEDSLQYNSNFRLREAMIEDKVLPKSNASECRSQNREDIERHEKWSEGLLIENENRLIKQDDWVQRGEDYIANKQTEYIGYIVDDSRAQNKNFVWDRPIKETYTENQDVWREQNRFGGHRFEMQEKSKDMWNVSCRPTYEGGYSESVRLDRNQGSIKFQSQDELNEPEPSYSETNRTVTHKRSYDGREKVYIHIDNEDCHSGWDKYSDCSVHSKNSGRDHNWERHNQLYRQDGEKSNEVSDLRSSGPRNFREHDDSWERSQHLEQPIKEREDEIYESHSGRKKFRTHNWSREDELDTPRREGRNDDFERESGRGHSVYIGHDNSWNRDRKFDKPSVRGRDGIYEPVYPRAPREIREQDSSWSRHDPFYRSNKVRSFKEIPERESRGKPSRFDEKVDNWGTSDELHRSDTKTVMRFHDHKDNSPKDNRFSHQWRSSERYEPYVRQNKLTERLFSRNKDDQYPPQDSSWMESNEWNQAGKPGKNRFDDQNQKRITKWQEHGIDDHKYNFPHTSVSHEQPKRGFAGRF